MSDSWAFDTQVSFTQIHKIHLKDDKLQHHPNASFTLTYSSPGTHIDVQADNTHTACCCTACCHQSAPATNTKLQHDRFHRLTHFSQSHGCKRQIFPIAQSLHWAVWQCAASFRIRCHMMSGAEIVMQDCGGFHTSWQALWWDFGREPGDSANSPHTLWFDFAWISSVNRPETREFEKHYTSVAFIRP